MRSATKPHRAAVDVSFEGACSLLESALRGRQQIVGQLLELEESGSALQRLRDSMRAHIWEVGTERIDLSRTVKLYDSLTRQDGFHVLNDWDGKADRVNDDIIPVDVLHYLIDKRRSAQAQVRHTDRTALAVLLDYYFMHLLSLLTLRVWDEGDADANFDRVDRLLQELQGPTGSGQLFATHGETLLLLATSHFEIHEWGYDKLLGRVRSLNRAHRVRIAVGHASSMGSHLRFGFEATYGRDTVVMRNDNVADYPWLCFALATLMSEYSRMNEEGAPASDRQRVVEAMLNGLTADARAFVGGAPPASLSGAEAERVAFRELFQRHRLDLLEQFEQYRPSVHAYSPISLFFNFSHNIVKGMVVDSLLTGEVWRLTFDDLLTALTSDQASGEAKQVLARTLMGYARSNPDRIRGRLKPVIVYDPAAGRQAFGVAMRKLRE